MRKIIMASLAMAFLASSIGFASAQITPSQGIQPAQSISKTSKGTKKSHGCHGKKCSKTKCTATK